jgi:hypothetical protein
VCVVHLKTTTWTCRCNCMHALKGPLQCTVATSSSIGTTHVTLQSTCASLQQAMQQVCFVKPLQHSGACTYAARTTDAKQTNPPQHHIDITPGAFAQAASLHLPGVVMVRHWRVLCQCACHTWCKNPWQPRRSYEHTTWMSVAHPSLFVAKLVQYNAA